jgi:hypothetical protein
MKTTGSQPARLVLLLLIILNSSKSDIAWVPPNCESRSRGQPCKIPIDPITNIRLGSGACRPSYPECANLSRGAGDSIDTEIARVACLRHLSSDKGDLA